MTGSAKQSFAPRKERMDCFVAFASRNDETRARHLSTRHSGAAHRAEPGIHNHYREWGFFDVQLHIKARAKEARPGMTRRGDFDDGQTAQ
jgi:hypothetical protein